MIKTGWCRKHINQKINIVRRMFKWATEYQLVPGSTYHALQSVSPLRIGRSDAPESNAVKPVPDALVDSTLPHVSRQVAAMIKLQRLSGMRPGEAVIMRGVDVDTSGTLWIYRPSRHKNLHRGHERIVYLGPQAQRIVREFLKPDLSQFLFSPADGEMERRLALHAARTTPLVFGNRPGTNKKRKPQKVAGERYTVMTYARAIRDACEAASPLPVPLARLRVPRADKKKGMRWESVAESKSRLGEQRWAERRAWQREHHWHPHQLRHTTATQLRKEFGLEAAQVILGHKTLTATQLYAEQNVASAMLIMQKVG